MRVVPSRVPAGAETGTSQDNFFHGRAPAFTRPPTINWARLAAKLLDSPPEFATAAPQRRSPAWPLAPTISSVYGAGVRRK